MPVSLRLIYNTLAVAGLLSAAALAPAQTAGPFTIRVEQGQNILNLGDGGNIPIPADALGVAASATVTLTYRGTGTVVLNTFDLTGSTDLTLSGITDLPKTLGRDQTLVFGIRYAPTSGNRALGRLVVSYVEGRTAGTFSINVTGTAPEFAFSYIPQGGNAAVLTNNGSVTFAVSPIDTKTTTTLVIVNRGTGNGIVKAIRLTGANFELAGVPLPDTVVEPGKELRFSVIYTPKQLEPAAGVVTIELLNQRLVFNLIGTGSGPVYAYETIRGTVVTPLPPNGQIQAGDVAPGEKASVQVRVRNNGNADARVAAIAVQGTGLSLSEVPFLPLTLTQGSTATFTLNFEPTQAGRVSGRLRVGDDTFEVTATGLGATLTYTAIAGTVTTGVQPSGTVNLAASAVGRASSTRFQINNTGTTPTTVNSISVIGANLTTFSLADVPTLPAAIEPGSSLPFTINFRPSALGNTIATLRVDNATFALTGSGTTPAPIPSYRFEGPAGPQAALQQPAVGLTLDAPYALRLTGTLTLALNSEVFSNDPSVQFATGGRTVNFSIPANSTRAIFPDGTDRIRLQTGTVAGTIRLTPSFVTDGGVDLTPTDPAGSNLTVPQSVPQLLNVVVSNKTGNAFTLNITGYATSRAITQLDLQFNPIAGENLSTTKLSLNAESSFLAWYQSAASQPFGSLFTVAVPLSLTGTVKGTNLSLADTIQSVSVTLTNRQGASNTRSADIK